MTADKNNKMLIKKVNMEIKPEEIQQSGQRPIRVASSLARPE